MTRFRFRLEGVLAWRRAERDAEEFRLRELAAAGARLEREAGELQAAVARAEAAVKGAENLAAADLWALAGFRAGAARRAAELARRRQENDRCVREQRARLAAADGRCRLLERLRDRRLAEWNYEAGREADAFASDAYLARWNAGGGRPPG